MKIRPKFSRELLVSLAVAILALGCGGRHGADKEPGAVAANRSTAATASSPVSPSLPSRRAEGTGREPSLVQKPVAAGPAKKEGAPVLPEQATSSSPTRAAAPERTGRTSAAPPLQMAKAGPPAIQIREGNPAGAGGTIRGQVVWVGVQPKPNPITPTKDPQVCGSHGPIPDESLLVDPETKGVRNVAAFLLKPSGAAPPSSPQGPALLDQKSCAFVPHVSGVRSGQRLILASQDPIPHNVHTNPYRNRAQNFLLLGTTRQEIEFSKAEWLPVKLTCDLHPWMSAYLLVLDHPYFAISGQDGSFEIRDVPPGNQHLILWQERTGPLAGYRSSGREVKVEAGKISELGSVPVQISDLRR